MKRISSISGIITNSSTQVYSINITDELLKLIKDNGLGDEILIIKDKSDVLKILEISEHDYTNYWKVTSLAELIQENSRYTLYGLIDSYELRGDIWRAIKESGKSDIEIFEFFEPLFSGIYGKAYYSYEDDCGNPRAAQILYNNGYESSRK